MRACNAEFDLDVSIYAARRLYNDNLIVAPTALPNCSFQGLYTRRTRREGEIVGMYVGDKLKTAQALRLQDKSYLMRLGEQSYVNAFKLDSKLTILSVRWLCDYSSDASTYECCTVS